MLRLALAALLLLGGPSWADSGMLLGGVSNRQMPLDALATPTACFSERRLRTAYVTNKGINIVRASDSTTSDIGFDAYGYPDKATETTFCNATTCKLVTQYDQCGSNNLTQATDANRYTRQAGPGVWNASQATAGTQTHAGASNITPATGVVTLGGVLNRVSGTGSCIVIRENGANNRLNATNASANSRTLTGGTSGSINSGAVAPDGTYIASVGVINGASSTLLNNSTTATGTATGNTTAGAPSFLGAASTTCNLVEEIIWDNSAFSAAAAAFYVSGARIGFGF